MKFPRVQVQQWVEENKKDILETFLSMLKIPAIAPKSGGEGEYDKAHFLITTMKSWGWAEDIHEINAPDPEAKNRVRPNLIVDYNPGDLVGPCLCVVTHMDVVPPGDESEWISPPFEPTIREGNLYARGSEDNGQELIASLFALKCLRELDLPVAHPIKLGFVADEELGSKFGIQYLLKTHQEFHPDDIVIVPDAGDPAGLKIEIAEKGILWVDVNVAGKQTHASRPGDGLNACRVGNKLAIKLDEILHGKFQGTNELFDPPVSTFEPTRRGNSVENINTIPGSDHQSWDCRVLPQHSLEQVMHVFKREATNLAKESGAQISIEYPQVQPSTGPVEEDRPVLLRLQKALKNVRGTPGEYFGMGGGTCAAFFRRHDIPAVVWSRIQEIAHQPNECCVLDYLFEDILVYCAFLGEFE